MVFNNYKAIKGSSVKKANIKMSYYLFQSLKSKVALYYFCWKSFEPYEFENKAWNKMKSVKYPDASLKKFFSLNPAVLFSPFQPAIWWAFYILLPFIALDFWFHSIMEEIWDLAQKNLVNVQGSYGILDQYLWMSATFKT